MRIHYRVDGPADAPLLVLANSLGTDLDMWSPTIPQWAGAFRLLRLDFRGHGGSELPSAVFGIEDLALDVVRLLDRIAVERASFCGLSLGGAVGQWLAVNEPGRMDRLVLACTSPRFGAPERWLERARTVRSGGLGAIADAVVGRWFTAGFAGREPATLAAFRKMLLATPPEAYAATCEALARWDYRSRLPEVEAPTLVLVGADDPVTQPHDVELLADGIPDAKLVVLPAAAHLANVEQPEAFGAAVSEHLAFQEAA